MPTFNNIRMAYCNWICRVQERRYSFSIKTTATWSPGFTGFSVYISELIMCKIKKFNALIKKDAHYYFTSSII